MNLNRNWQKFPVLRSILVFVMAQSECVDKPGSPTPTCTSVRRIYGFCDFCAFVELASLRVFSVGRSSTPTPGTSVYAASLSRFHQAAFSAFPRLEVEEK
jgi:hypothetical protein